MRRSEKRIPPPLLSEDPVFAGLEAVRTALQEAAAWRRVRSAIRDEVARIAADEADREEMRIIREQMAELAPPTST